MDWWILKQLRAMVINDLREFIPEGYFDSELEKFTLHQKLKNSKHFSNELRWGYLAGKLGHRLFFETTAIMSARQVSASEVLMNLGMLAAVESAQGACTQLSEDANAMEVSDGNAGVVAEQFNVQHIPTLSNNVRGALKQYMHHLSPSEAKPFLSLLDGASDTQSGCAQNLFVTNLEGVYPMANNIHIHGNVGSVQTGSNSVARVVLNLNTNERGALDTALQQVKESISTESSLDDQKRQELLEMVQECISQTSSMSPNETKLFTTLSVLGTTIQSIASVQPAYQTLKAAAQAIGLTLP